MTRQERYAREIQLKDISIHDTSLHACFVHDCLFKPVLFGTENSVTSPPNYLFFYYHCAKNHLAMAESKITLDPKYNKPQQEVDTVAKDSILKTLQDLCTGPEYDEYRDAKRDIDVALDLLINY